MQNLLLIDTNIIIDCLRNHEPAVHYIKKTRQPFLLSVLTVAEIFAGIRSEREKKIVESFFIDFQIVPIEHEVAQLGGAFKEQYNKSHGTCLIDALIAATAAHHKATLVTRNTKHFPMIKAVKPY